MSPSSVTHRSGPSAVVQAYTWPCLASSHICYLSFSLLLTPPDALFCVLLTSVAVSPWPVTCLSCSAAHSRYKPAPACVGISPEQAQRLLDGECLPLHGSQLCQHIHPPPAIQSVDLVRQAEKDLEVLFPPRRDSTAAGNGPAKSDLARGAMIGPERERETSRDGGSSMYGPRRDDSGRTRVFPALAINPADTLHLQMTPKVWWVMCQLQTVS